MLWSAFKTAVESHLAVETNRRGMEAFRARHMRNAVLDLQRYIRAYRSPFKTTYAVANVTTIGVAQQIALPSGVVLPKALYIYKIDDVDQPYNDECCRERLERYDWNARQDLICGKLNFATAAACGCSVGGCAVEPVTAEDLQAWLAKAYVYTMAPMGRYIIFYPQITASTRLLLLFESMTYSPADGDDVPFPEQASEAVAAYLMSRISKVVNKDPAMAADYDLEYRKLRLALYRDAMQEGVNDLSEDPLPQELGATTVAPP